MGGLGGVCLGCSSAVEFLNAMCEWCRGEGCRHEEQVTTPLNPCYTFIVLQVFTYKWSVNWQLLPEPAFLSRQLALALLYLHLRLLWSLAQKSWWVAFPRDAVMSRCRCINVAFPCDAFRVAVALMLRSFFL